LPFFHFSGLAKWQFEKSGKDRFRFTGKNCGTVLQKKANNNPISEILATFAPKKTIAGKNALPY